VNTKTRGDIPKGRPAEAMSSPTATTADFAAVKDGYMYEEPKDKNGVENPKLKNPVKRQTNSGYQLLTNSKQKQVYTCSYV
jgi:hypothetical protein